MPVGILKVKVLQITFFKLFMKLEAFLAPCSCVLSSVSRGVPHTAGAD